MFKQILLLIILSILAVLFASQVGFVLVLLVRGHEYISQLLSYVFSGDHIGRLVREIVILAGIPIIIGLIANLIYWLVRKHALPILIPLMWIIWIILLTSTQ